MAIEDEDILSIIQSIAISNIRKDAGGVYRGLQDLSDAGIEPVLHLKVISISGHRIKYHINFLSQKIKIDKIEPITDGKIISYYTNLLNNFSIPSDLYGSNFKRICDMNDSEKYWISTK